MSAEQLLGELEGDGRYVVGDLEAGTGTILRLRPGQVDVVVIVAQPTVKAIDVAARTLRTVQHRGTAAIVVANRVTSEDDVDLIRSGLMGHEVLAVPDDDAIRRADENGSAPLDVTAASPGLRALTAVAERIMQFG